MENTVVGSRVVDERIVLRAMEQLISSSAFLIARRMLVRGTV